LRVLHEMVIALLFKPQIHKQLIFLVFSVETVLMSELLRLIDTFEGFESDSLRVSVVPFAQYVNVGESRRGARWLDVPEDQLVTARRRDVVSRSNCRDVTRNVTRDGVVTTRRGRQCDKVFGEPRNVTFTATWEGCVGSRLAQCGEGNNFITRS